VASIRFRLRLIGIGVELFEGVSLGSILLLAAIGLSITSASWASSHGPWRDDHAGPIRPSVVQEVFVGYLPPQWIGAYWCGLARRFVVSGLFGYWSSAASYDSSTDARWRPCWRPGASASCCSQLVRTILVPTIAPSPIRLDDRRGGALGGFTLTWNRLAISSSACRPGGLAALMRFSGFGLSCARCRRTAHGRGMGIRTGRVDALHFGLGSASPESPASPVQIGNVSPNLGQTYIVDSFMVGSSAASARSGRTLAWRFQPGHRHQAAGALRRGDPRQDLRAGDRHPVPSSAGRAASSPQRRSVES